MTGDGRPKAARSWPGRAGVPAGSAKPIWEVRGGIEASSSRVANGKQVSDVPTAADLAVVARQLGRPPRAVYAVAHRCACGLPDVVETWPRLDDGTPFPTLYYLTCPRACAAVSRLEAAGTMREMTARLSGDPDLAAAYAAAHRDYLARRDVHEVLSGAPGAGGMPDRVKCLHVLVAHSLATGRGVNPFGDEALDMIGCWSYRGPCVASPILSPDPDPDPDPDPLPDPDPAGGTGESGRHESGRHD